jgi:DNA repair exonuclease SbcCD ATPase subunit
MLLEQLVEKLDFLLSFYLRMRYSLTRYQNYFNSTDPERIQERIAMLEHEMKSGPERVQQIKARTRSVLEKRLDRYKKAVENRDLIDAQTETVQEVLQLLRDQSYSMRDPRSITEQIDGLVSSAEETERGVKDMEEILAMENDLMSPGSLEADIEQELQTSRPGAVAAPSGPAAPVRARVPPPPGSPPPPPRKKLIQ